MAKQDRLSIVVGVDGHETGRRALDWALREAQVGDCPVQVVHAWTFDPMAEYFTETSSQQVHQESLAIPIAQQSLNDLLRGAALIDAKRRQRLA